MSATSLQAPVEAPSPRRNDPLLTPFRIKKV